MIAVVMAGGEGARLRPLTLDLPKPLAPIANKPVMHHIVDLLRAHGITDILATIHYKGDSIESYFGDGSAFGVRMRYVREESPLGTAGAVGLAREILGNDAFLIISGDALTDIDLNSFIARHRGSGAVASIAVRQVSDPREFGVIDADAHGRIVRFLEKPSWSEAFSDTVNTGIYVLEPAVLDAIPSGKPCDFAKDVFPRLLAAEHPMQAVALDGYWSDVGSLEQYKTANEDALYGRVRLELPGIEVRQGVRCGSGCRIHPDAVVESPVILGNDVVIEAGAYIAASAIGTATHIGGDAYVAAAVLSHGVQISRGADVKACIVGEDAIVGAGASIEENAVIGRACFVGSDATVKSGIKMWPLRSVAEGAVVSMSMVHRLTWPQSIFDDEGVRGIVNLEIDSQLAARLGEAFGTTLAAGNAVVVGSDSHKSSRAIAGSIAAGLLSTGVEVIAAGSAPAPVVRAAVRSAGHGGVYVRADCDAPATVQIEFVDAHGINLSRASQRKIEGIFARDEFRKASVEDIGLLRDGGERVYDLYASGLATMLPPSLQIGRFQVILNMTNTSLERVLCDAFAHTGLDVRLVKSTSIARLADAIRERGANCGIHFEEAGDAFTLLDERGVQVSAEDLLPVATLLLAQAVPKARLAVPVKASSVIDSIAEKFRATVARTANAATASMVFVAQNASAYDLASYDGLTPIFPQGSPVPDAFYAAIRLADLARAAERPLSEVVAALPSMARTRQTVHCPQHRKVGIMRLLREDLPGAESVPAGGIRVRADGSWALVLPDAADSFTILGEGTTNSEAAELVNEVARRIQSLAEAA